MFSRVGRGHHCCSSDPANDIVGDNVHDIVGMGADLFRSFARAARRGAGSRGVAN